MQKVSTFTFIIAGCLALLMTAHPTVIQADTIKQKFHIQKKFVKKQFYHWLRYINKKTEQTTITSLISTASRLQKNNFTFQNKLIKQKLRPALRRMTRRFARHGHDIKKVLWGPGNFQNHYLRRITSFATAAISTFTIIDKLLKQSQPQKKPVLQEQYDPMVLYGKLCEAAQQNNLGEARELLQKGASPSRTFFGRNNDSPHVQLDDPLSIATAHGHEDVVRILLEYTVPEHMNIPQANVDPNSHQEQFKEILVLAMQNPLKIIAESQNPEKSHIAIIELLLGHLDHHNVRYSGPSAQSIGLSAIHSKQPTVILALLDHADKHNFFDNESVQALLKWMVDDNRTDLARELTNRNFFSSSHSAISVDDIRNNIKYAMENGRTDIVNILLDCGGISYEQINSQYLWEYAITDPEDVLLHTLLRKRTEAREERVNDNNDDLNALLDYAVDLDKAQRLRLLCERRAIDNNLDRESRETLLDKAIKQNKSLETIQVLIAHGARLSKTALGEESCFDELDYNNDRTKALVPILIANRKSIELDEQRALQLTAHAGLSEEVRVHERLQESDKNQNEINEKQIFAAAERNGTRQALNNVVIAFEMWRRTIRA